MSLIRVQQHTPEDLEAWATWEREDAWRARQVAFPSLVRRALAELEAFAAAGPCHVSVSWGKDSCVVAHLAWTLREERGIDLPLSHVRIPPLDNPHSVLVRDAFLERWPMRYHETESPCFWYGGEWHTVREGASAHQLGAFELGFQAACQALGSERYVTGIRGQESGRRKMSMRHLGLSTARACRPLGWWTAADVYAYLHAHDLPVHPAYAMTFGGRIDRAHLRVDALGLDAGTMFGRREWEEHYYREHLR